MFIIHSLIAITKDLWSVQEDKLLQFKYKKPSTEEEGASSQIMPGCGERIRMGE